jgi:pyruvate formate lyase activating enzyme
MGEGEKGYCGLRMNVNGKLVAFSKPDEAVLHAYRDPHITNCLGAD